MLSPDNPASPDQPVVVRVTARRRIEPALIVGVLVVGMVGVALWKPWVGVRPAIASPAPSGSGREAAAASAAPVPIGSPAVAAPAPVSAAPTLPALFGLDLGFMGTSDPHAAWGVAVAYVPTGNIVAAVSGNVPTITPAVEWALQGASGGGSGGGSLPGTTGPGPILGHPRTVTVAVAVTWPAMPRPRTVRLLRLGTTIPPPGGTARLPAPELVSLAEPLPLLVRVASPGSAAFEAAPSDRWALTSGTFFLPPHGPPGALAGWLDGGWRPGAYAFVVTGADGSARTLPFILRG